MLLIVYEFNEELVKIKTKIGIGAYKWKQGGEMNLKDIGERRWAEKVRQLTIKFNYVSCVIFIGEPDCDGKTSPGGAHSAMLGAWKGCCARYRCLDLPAFFSSGDSDYQLPLKLIQAFLVKINQPVWFSNSHTGMLLC